MSSAYTPTPVVLSTVTLPDDGDPRNAASVGIPLRQLANAIAESNSRIAPLVRVAAFRPQFITAQTEALPAWTLTKVAYAFDSWNISGAVHGTNTNGPPAVSSLGLSSIQQVNTASNATWLMGMRLGPDLLSQGRTLSQLIMYIDPGTGRAATPAQQPQLAVYRTKFDGSAAPQALLSTNNGWDVQTVVGLANYETRHSRGFTPNQNNAIDHTQYAYDLLFSNECGTNAQAGVKVYGIQITMT